MQRDIVFSAEWDDRAAELRGDAEALHALRRDPATRVLPVWRGRPLVAGAGQNALGWVSPGHPVLDQAKDDWILLGRHGDAVHFAADISSWRPDTLNQQAMAAFLDPTEYHHPSVPVDHLFADLRMVMTKLDAADAAMASTARGVLNWHRSHRFCSSCGQPSKISMAGWQRACPSCAASHFPRTDPVVIMLVLRGNKLLLGRSPGWPEGMYSALAGFVEPGETLEAAVRREVFEETRITVSNVRYVAGQPWAFPNSLMLGFVAQAEDEDITIDPAELDDAIWLTREDMVDVMAGLHPTIRRPRSGAIAAELVARWLGGTLF